MLLRVAFFAYTSPSSIMSKTRLGVSCNLDLLVRDLNVCSDANGVTEGHVGQCDVFPETSGIFPARTLRVKADGFTDVLVHAAIPRVRRSVLQSSDYHSVAHPAPRPIPAYNQTARSIIGKYF